MPAPPPLTIPAACGLLPVEPQAVDEPTLPPLPASTAPGYLATRTQRAELAGLFFQGQRDAYEGAYNTNAASQRLCAAWAREHQPTLPPVTR